MNHARLGPSAAARWTKCTKSISFVEGLIRAGTIPEKETPSEYAKEGIELHDVIANAMQAVQAQLVRADWWLVEQRVEIPLGKPDQKTFGTADMLGYDEIMATAHVIDWKFGRGVPVDAHDNIQLALYAWGWITELRRQKRVVETIEMTICQPRIKDRKLHGRTWRVSVDELLAFLTPVFESAQQIHADVKTDFFRSNATCRWCRGKPHCPEHNNSASSDEEIVNLINSIEVQNYE